MFPISLKVCGYIFFFTAAILLISESRFKGTRQLNIIRMIGYPIFIGVLVLELTGIPQ